MALTAESGAGSYPAINSGLKDQASLIRLQIAEEMMMEDPYSASFEGGTVGPHEGETITTQVPGRPVMNQALTVTEVTTKSALCNTQGPRATFGSEQYTALLQGIRFHSPWLCVHDNFNKLERETDAHVTMFKRGIKEWMIADARSNLLVNSGHKYVANVNLTPLGRITGAEYSVAVDFAGPEPDARITHKELVRICKHIQTTARTVQFGTGAGAHVRFVGSAELIEAMRDEAGLKNETLAFVQGGDAAASKAFRGYSFAKYPYRGIMTAEDPIPLRFNSVDGDGFPILLPPYEPQVGDEGEHWIISDDWINAANEVAFLIWKGSFRRLVPEAFTRDGEATWPAQSIVGETEWLNIRDNDFNVFGDRGQFVSQVIRAWQPVSPWSCMPILTRRCEPTDDLVACNTVSEAE